MSFQDANSAVMPTCQSQGPKASYVSNACGIMLYSVLRVSSVVNDLSGGDENRCVRWGKAVPP